MVTGGNIYGSYYSALLTGVNLTSQSAKPSGLNRGAPTDRSPYSFTGIDIEKANSLYAMKTGAAKLNSILNMLNSPSLFENRSAVSSKPDAVAVSGSPDKNFTDASISVMQVAAGQINEGNELVSSARMISGTHEFQIEAGGMMQLFSVQIKPGDTNKTLQNKMAKAINESKIGVKAEVEERNDLSRLVLSSMFEGEVDEASFSIHDITGSAVERTGVRDKTHEPINARFTLDGEELSSTSNELKLLGGVRATLKQVTDEPVTLWARPDVKDAALAIVDMAQSVNDLLSNAQSAGITKLYSDVANAGISYSNSLRKLGINQDSNGYMTLNQETLMQSANDGSLESLIQDFNSQSFGYTQSLNRVAKTASKNPAGYSINGTFNQFLGAGMYLNMVV